jgi:cobalt-zinc-cadmium efflux system outer membrane protein
MKKAIIATALTLACGAHLCAQTEEVLTFDRYIENVKNGNMTYLAEMYEVDIADANLKAARIFPDPELSVSYGNNQNWNLQMGYAIEAELGYTVELGRKRKARINLAQSEKEMSAALLEDYLRNLRADATLAYLTVLKQNRLCEIQKSSYHQMRRLAEADSLRYLLGDIMEIDARQSKLEAASLLNCVYAGEGDRRESMAGLLLFQGDKGVVLPDSIAGELAYTRQAFNLSTLIATALHNRADLQATLKAQEAATHNLRLAKANRYIDLGLTLGGTYASEVKNEIAPAPAYKGFTVGVSVPLQLSNTNKGTRRAAQLAVRQAEARLAAAEAQITNEVIQAYNKYLTTWQQVEQYDAGLLQEAEAIFTKKAYSYHRGETSILDLLTAQRTYNDLQSTYTETLYDCAAALVEVQRATGTHAH